MLGRQLLFRYQRIKPNSAVRFATSWKAKNLAESKFHEIADETLNAVETRLDRGDLDSCGLDVEYSDGVLNIELGDRGTWVLCKQTPNRQLWLSSPISGPNRYDFEEQRKRWENTRDGHLLAKVLTDEFTKCSGKEVRFDSEF